MCICMDSKSFPDVYVCASQQTQTSIQTVHTHFLRTLPLSTKNVQI